MSLIPTLSIFQMNSFQLRKDFHHFTSKVSKTNQQDVIRCFICLKNPYEVRCGWFLCIG